MSINLRSFQPDGVAGLLFCLSLAVVFVGGVFGLDFVAGHSAFWRTEVRDVTQYVAGFNFYFNAPWQSPWLSFDALNYPQGSLATFVDAIPIYAFLLKLIVPSTWAPFNPYGAWVGLCFLLQAVGGWWIAKELRTKSWVFLVTLVGLLLSFPALLDRIGHISLMSHWLLLFALALYLKTHTQVAWPLKSWAALCIVAFYINIYVCVMVCGVFASAWLSAPPQAAIKRVQALVLPAVLLLATAFFAVWPLPSGNPTPEFGFGYYSLNLASPWMGGSILPLPTWLGLNPIAGFTYVGQAGQYEGFNYVGLGVLLLVCASAVRMLQSAKRHKPLFTLMIVFTVYALSDRVFLGQHVLLEFHYPQWLLPLTSQFRASGRFFWLAGYVLTIWSLYHIYQALKPRQFAVVALVVIVIQLMDLQGVYQGLSFRLHREDAAVINTSQWDAAIGSEVRVLYAYPKFKCGKDPQNTLLPLMKYASERQLKLNTGYIARYTPDCLDMKAEVALSNPATSAYVLSSGALAAGVPAETIFPSSWAVRCEPIDFAQVCQVTQWPKTP
jgi:hypothetical protein